jgi:hypothetical protein
MCVNIITVSTHIISSSSSSCCCCCGNEYLASYCGRFISTERDSVMRFKGELIPETIWTREERCRFGLERNSCFIAIVIIIHIRPKSVIFTQILPLTLCTIFYIIIIIIIHNYYMFRPYMYRPSSGSDNSRLRVQRIWLKHIEVVYNNKYKNIVQLAGGKICMY